MARRSIGLTIALLFSLASLLATTNIRSSTDVSSMDVPAGVEAADTTSRVVPRPEEVRKAYDRDDRESTKSPLRALLRSAVIPGWGQLYTGHPYRGGLILGVEALLLAFSWSENNNADRSWDLYQETNDPFYFDEYDRQFDRGRTLMSFGIGLFVFNLADAYVSAHLYNFEDKVSFEQDEDRLSISMKWRFH